MHTRSERFPSVRAAALAYRFRESLFALPLLIVVGGMALAVITRVVDGNIGPSPRYLLQMDSGVATTLLSTIAGATITTAGVIFSLTIVSLQLASSQLSPRVMRWFIRDRLSQVVIGLLVATFVYCVLSLPDLDGSSPVPAPPLMSATLPSTRPTKCLLSVKWSPKCLVCKGLCRLPAANRVWSGCRAAPR